MFTVGTSTSKCLDVLGNDNGGDGTPVDVWDCLDDPSGNTTNGTQLQIWNCNGDPAQLFIPAL